MRRHGGTQEPLGFQTRSRAAFCDEREPRHARALHVHRSKGTVQRLSTQAAPGNQEARQLPCSCRRPRRARVRWGAAWGSAHAGTRGCGGLRVYRESLHARGSGRAPHAGTPRAAAYAASWPGTAPPPPSGKLLSSSRLPGITVIWPSGFIGCTRLGVHHARAAARRRRRRLSAATRRRPGRRRAAPWGQAGGKGEGGGGRVVRGGGAGRQEEGGLGEGGVANQELRQQTRPANVGDATDGACVAPHADKPGP